MSNESTTSSKNTRLKHPALRLSEHILWWALPIWLLVVVGWGGFSAISMISGSLSAVTTDICTKKLTGLGYETGQGELK